MVHTAQFKKIRESIARWIAPDAFYDIENSINQRVAFLASNIDPFEHMMKRFHGVFSKEYERPEEMLDERSQFNMKMWGWQQAKDPCFKYLTDWIMNVQANETLKRAAVTTERIMYGRAQVSCMLLYVKEIERLASLYQEILDKDKEDPDFQASTAVDT